MNYFDLFHRWNPNYITGKECELQPELNKERIFELRIFYKMNQSNSVLGDSVVRGHIQWIYSD